MKPTGKPEHQGRARRAVGEQLQQAKQRGRRIADRDHRTRQPGSPSRRPRPPSGWCAAGRGALLRRLVIEACTGSDWPPAALAPDAGSHHGRIDQDRRAPRAAPRGRHRRHPPSRRGRPRCPACRRRGSGAAPPAAGPPATARSAPRGGSRRRIHDRSRPGRADSCPDRVHRIHYRDGGSGDRPIAGVRMVAACG